MPDDGESGRRPSPLLKTRRLKDGDNGAEGLMMGFMSACRHYLNLLKIKKIMSIEVVTHSFFWIKSKEKRKNKKETRVEEELSL